MIDRPFISHFSPQRTDPELLEQIHVQRHELLAESVARVRESVLTQDKHHLLFIGPRGAGKTHLVRLIHHRLSQEARTHPQLAQRLRFAWLNEDETATSFLKLLILIYRDVSQRYPEEFPAADLQSIYGQSADLAREQLGASLLRHLGADRTLVVLMENLDSLFKHMPEGEQRIWRAFVQNHPVFATVGTAQSLFDGVSDRDQPFFGFFDTLHLQPLSVADAVQLLEKLARLKKDDALADFLLTPTGHARVQAIHDLAGGNPRIYLIFSEFLTKESLDDLVRPFEETADRQLTSYYQERLRWLSAQQQEIIQLLCHHGQPVPVKTIAEGLFTTHNSITGQLKVLREMRYVISNPKGREVFYELAEPLMRLALQIKETHDRRPLTLIVDFLRVWYDRKDLEDRLQLQSPNSPWRAYFAEALEKLDSGEPNLRHVLLERGLEDFEPEKCDEATFNRLQSLAEERGSLEDWLRLMNVMLHREHHEGTIHAATKLIESPAADNEVKAAAFFFKGDAFKSMGKTELALQEFDSMILLGCGDENLRFMAYSHRAFARITKGMFPGAIEDLNIAEKFKAPDGQMLEKLWLLRGMLHGMQDNWHHAVDDFSRGIPELLRMQKEGENWPQGLPRIILTAILRHSADPKKWGECLNQIFPSLIDPEMKMRTFSAIVLSLADFKDGTVHLALADAWIERIKLASALMPPNDGAGLETILRMFNLGVSFLRSGDESELLAAPIEERGILRAALGLLEETQS